MIGRVVLDPFCILARVLFVIIDLTLCYYSDCRAGSVIYETSAKRIVCEFDSALNCESMDFYFYGALCGFMSSIAYVGI